MSSVLLWRTLYAGKTGEACPCLFRAVPARSPPRRGRAPERRRGQMNELSRFLEEEDGVAVVEVVLILLVLIALVLIFKSQITNVLKTILGKAASQSGSV